MHESTRLALADRARATAEHALRAIELPSPAAAAAGIMASSQPYESRTLEGELVCADDVVVDLDAAAAAGVPGDAGDAASVRTAAAAESSSPRASGGAPPADVPRQLASDEDGSTQAGVLVIVQPRDGTAAAALDAVPGTSGGIGAAVDAAPAKVRRRVFVAPAGGEQQQRRYLLACEVLRAAGYSTPNTDAIITDLFRAAAHKASEMGLPIPRLPSKVRGHWGE